MPKTTTRILVVAVCIQCVLQSRVRLVKKLQRVRESTDEQINDTALELATTMEEMETFSFSQELLNVSKTGCQEKALWSLCRTIADGKNPQCDCNDCKSLLKLVLPASPPKDKNVDCSSATYPILSNSCPNAAELFTRNEKLAKNWACRNIIADTTVKRQKHEGKPNIMTKPPKCSEKNDNLNVWDANAIDPPNPVNILGISTSAGVGKIDIIRATTCSSNGGDLMNYALSRFAKMKCKKVFLQDDSKVTCRDDASTWGPLRVLYMLNHNGLSWYESFGFKSLDPKYDESKAVLMMPLHMFSELLSCGATQLAECQLALEVLGNNATSDATVFDWLHAVYDFKDLDRCRRGMAIANLFQNAFFNAGWHSIVPLCGRDRAAEIWGQYGEMLKSFSAKWGDQYFELTF